MYHNCITDKYLLNAYRRKHMLNIANKDNVVPFYPVKLFENYVSV